MKETRGAFGAHRVHCRLKLFQDSKWAVLAPQIIENENDPSKTPTRDFCQIEDIGNIRSIGNIRKIMIIRKNSNTPDFRQKTIPEISGTSRIS